MEEKKKKKKKKKKKINWQSRKEEFISLLEPFKSKDGSWDCIVPWSGGKDSSSIAWKLKYEYGMNPLLVTFSQYCQMKWAITIERL